MLAKADAARIVASLPQARERWLQGVLTAIEAESVWVGGSVGRGTADAWSDLDLILVGGQAPTSDALVSFESGHNGPRGGGYVGAMYALDPIVLWVDWYLWPVGLAVPSDAKVASGTGVQSNLTLMAAIESHGRGVDREPVDQDVWKLSMIPLAAKYLARGDAGSAAAMAQLLHISPDGDVLQGLSRILAKISGHETARQRIVSYLEIVRLLA